MKRTPGHRQRKAEYDREYRKRNLEFLRERSRQWHRSHLAYASKRALDWSRKNPAARRAIAAAYKARRRAQCEGGMSGPALRAWIAEQELVCAYCRIDCSDAFEIDHVLALSRGGKHEIHNLAIACPTCNRRKSNRLLEDFLRDFHSLASSRCARAVGTLSSSRGDRCSGAAVLPDKDMDADPVTEADLDGFIFAYSGDCSHHLAECQMTVLQTHEADKLIGAAATVCRVGGVIAGPSRRP
jgi:5-methylcytosine-specific restriction endonuclease McrA